jgi:hypothetical protein
MFDSRAGSLENEIFNDDDLQHVNLDLLYFTHLGVFTRTFLD